MCIRDRCAGELLHYPAAAKLRMHDDLARILRADLADHRRAAPEFMRAHRREDIFRVLRRDDREQLTLVGAVHRVKPQHIAGSLHLTAHLLMDKGKRILYKA